MSTSSPTSTQRPAAKPNRMSSPASGADSDLTQTPFHARNHSHDPNPNPSHSPSPHQSQQEPTLDGGAGSDAGELGDEFIREAGPEAEVIPPSSDLISPEEFVERFASWFEMPAEILTGTPTQNSQRAAAKALYREIAKSSNTWFRALASKQVGTIGNWAIVLGHLASVARGMANAMGAANNVGPAPQGEQQQQQGGGETWPPRQ